MALAAQVNPEENNKPTIPLGVVSPIEHGAKKAISWRQDPIAFTAWFSAFVLLNGSIIKFLNTQVTFGAFNETANYILGIGELAVTIFAVCVACALFGKSIFNGFRRFIVPVELNFLGAIVTLGGFSFFLGIGNVGALAGRPILEWFSLFAFIFSITLLARRKGEDKLITSSKARLSELAPIGRIVRPASQFKLATTGSQGELFPPEETVEVPATSLRPGDIVRIKVSEIAPCDGVVAEGGAIVEERRYSGVSHLRSKERGDEIFAGSRIIKGNLDVKVGLSQNDSLGSTFEREILNVGEQVAGDPELTHRTSLINLVTFFVAILVGVIASYEGQEIQRVASLVAGIFSLSLLLSLVGIGQVVGRSVLGRAFAKGILIRGYSVLSRLSGRRTPVFTSDPLDVFNEPHAISLHLTDSRIDRKELGSVILGLALKAEHPIFREVVKLLHSREKIELKVLKIEDLREFHGRGLTGVVSGADFTIGFEDFLMDRGVYLQSSDAVPTGAEQVMYVAVGDEVVARIMFEEIAVRFKKVGIEPLSSRGIRSVLLGSVTQDRLDTLGQQLGFELSSIFGALDAKGKRAKVTSLGETILYGADNREGLDEASKDHQNSITIGIFDDLQAAAPAADVVVFRRSARLFPVFNLLGEKLSWATTEWKIIAGISLGLILVSMAVGAFTPLVPALLTLILIGYALTWPLRVSSVFEEI